MVYKTHKKTASKNLIEEYIIKIFNKIKNRLGKSKHQKEYPGLEIIFETDENISGEYCEESNDIRIYLQNIGSSEEIIRTVLHEYAHYLQCRKWMKRYYKMGHTYETHPYEIQAKHIEEQWKSYI